jgi:hypothetical protein
VGGEGCDAHDVGHLALESGLVVARLGDERVHVLGYATLGRVHRVHDLAVPVPDDLGRGVAAPGLACELDLLTPAKCLALDVALDVRCTRWVCGQGKTPRQPLYIPLRRAIEHGYLSYPVLSMRLTASSVRVAGSTRKIKHFEIRPSIDSLLRFTIYRLYLTSSRERI